MSTKTKGDILAERIEKIGVRLNNGGDINTIVADILTALTDYHKPWKLGRSVNGFTLGDGQEWHSNDWTEDMLPEGCRPLILGEVNTDEDEWLDYAGFWKSCKGGRHFQIKDGHKQHRTRRPLPSTKKMVPLGPEDVKCGDEIRAIGHIFRRSIVFVDEFKVGVFNASYSFQDLKSHYKINRHDGKGFVPCEKPSN